MKKYATVAMAAILIAGTVKAQNVNVGIKAGANLYNINNDNNVSYDPKVGFNAGLIGHIHLARQFAIQPEVTFSTQGAKYTTAGVETKLKRNYVNVPVMFQYMFDNGFRLQAGPQVGFLANASSVTGKTSVDTKDNLKGVDFGVGAGIGYVHPASGFGVDARYNLGLTNTNKSDAVKSTNRGAQVGVFYLFKHK